MRVRLGLLAAAALAISAVPAAALAAVDAFIWFDNVPGESSDAGHKGWIEVSSFSWGAGGHSNMGSASSGGGAGKVSMHEIVITKRTDRSSPLLRMAASNGRHFNEVKLEMRKAGGERSTTYMTYVLHDVLVSGVQTRGGGEEGPEESVTLNFASMETRSQGASDDDSAPRRDTVRSIGPARNFGN